MTRGQVLVAGLFSVSLSAMFVGPAFAAGAALPIIYGTYTDPISGISNSDNSPTIVPDGLPSPFQVDNLTVGGPAQDANNDAGGLLFTVDPASCITGSGRTCVNNRGIETATITVDFTFYNASNHLIGTASDTALATFDYATQTDNICWSNTNVGGTALVSSQMVNSCGSYLSSTAVTNAYEQIAVNLNGYTYDVNLYDWNDWNEQPKVTFQGISGPSNVPEPASLALLVAGLLGLGGLMVVRRRRIAAQAV